MILLAQVDEMIQCPVSRLYPFVTNMENYKNWFPGVIDIVSGNALAHGQVGKEYVETLDLTTGRRTLRIVVRQVEPNQIFITESDLEPVLPRMEMRFRDGLPEGCQFNLSYYSRNTELDPNGQLITSIQQDLGERIVSAIRQLKNRV